MPLKIYFRYTLHNSVHIDAQNCKRPYIDAQNCKPPYIDAQNCKRPYIDAQNCKRPYIVPYDVYYAVH